MKMVSFPLLNIFFKVMNYLGQLQAKPTEIKASNNQSIKVQKPATTLNKNSNDQPIINDSMNNNNLKQNSMADFIKGLFIKLCDVTRLLCSVFFNKLYNYFDNSTPQQKCVIICTVLSWLLVFLMFLCSF